MKILRIVLLIIVVLQIKNLSQVTQEWVSFYSRDASQGNALGIDKQGNVIVTGNSGYDWITIKYSPDGDLLWENLLESPIQQPNQNYEIAIDPWGNAVVVGTAYHDSTWEKHWCVAKYNSIDGHQEWIEYMFHPTQHIDDDALDVAIDSSGRAIVAGTIFNGTYIDQGTGFDWIVKCYTPRGGIHWFDQFDHNITGDVARRVVCTETGIAYVCGTSLDTSHTFYQVKLHKYHYYGPDWDKHINVLGDEPQPHIAIDENQNVYLAYDDGFKYTSNDIILIKFDSLGNIQWKNTINTPESLDNSVVDIKTDTEGNVVFTSIYKDESRYFHCHTVKYNAGGDLLWSVIEDEGTYPSKLAIDKQNNIYVGGKTPEMAVKYDPNGNVVWREGYIGASARDIGVDDNGNVFLTGNYSSDIITIKFSQVVGVDDNDEPHQPENYKLSQNYPNPFNPSTAIKYEIPNVEKGHAPFVRLVVYDVLGREVATLVNEQQKAGEYEVQFTITSVNGKITSGIYFYQLISGNYIETKKMLLIK